MEKASFYISGKISGLPDLNKLKFSLAEQNIELLYGDRIVINPHKLAHNHKKTWGMYMRADIRAMLRCDIVVALDDWKNSRGAIIEVLLASTLDMPILCANKLGTHKAEIALTFYTKAKLLLKLLLNNF